MSQRFLNGTGSDAVLLVDASSGNEQVVLPRNFATGRRFTVRRIDGSVTVVSVSAASGDYIDGSLNSTKDVPGNGEIGFVPLETGRWESFGGTVSGGGALTPDSVGTAELRDASVTAVKVAADVATVAALVAGLLTKASTSHAGSHAAAGGDPVTLSQSQIAGLAAALVAKADLVAGLIPSSQMPPLAINTITPVASQAAMLALSVQRGDAAIRTDNGKTFILATDSPSTLADWKEILAVGAIVSVAGKTGVVALTAADITSGTFDIARLPVGTSGATVAAGNDSRITGAAADSIVVHLTGAETIAGTKTFSSSPVIPDATLATHPASKGQLDAISGATAPDATSATKGIVRLFGDLGGTASSPSVTKISGITISGTPTAGATLVATSATAASWQVVGTPPVAPTPFLVIGRSGLPWNSGAFFGGTNAADAAGSPASTLRAAPMDAYLTFVTRDTWANMHTIDSSWAAWPGILVISIPMQPEGSSDAATAAGTNNTRWVDYGTALAGAGLNRSRTVIRLGWEQNGNWYDWAWGGSANTPTQYVTAVKAVVTSLRSTAPNVKINSNFNKNNKRADGVTWQSVMSQLIGYVDVIGLDTYDMWNAATNLVNWNAYQLNQDPGLASIADFCRTNNLLMSLDEWAPVASASTDAGGTGGGDNPYYVTQMWDWLVANKDVIAYESFYDQAGTGDYNHLITDGSKPNLATAYRSAARWGKTTSSRDALVPGSYEPDATTTGLVTSLGSLTTYAGPSTLTTDNAIYDSLRFDMDIVIAANNLTFTNCAFFGGSNGTRALIDCSGTSAGTITITDSILKVASPMVSKNCIRGRRYTLNRCDVSQGVDLCRVYYPPDYTARLDVRVTNSYLHDMAWFASDPDQSGGRTHNDAFQIVGSKGSTNWGLPPAWQAGAVTPRNVHVRWNSIHGSYSTTVGDSGRPTRGTGTTANGNLNFGDLTCIQWTAGSGLYTEGVDVWENWIYGGFRAVNAGSAAPMNIGSVWRNRFDDSQGQRYTQPTDLGATLNVDADTTVAAGDGGSGYADTANANHYMPGVRSGVAISVRRNA